MILQAASFLLGLAGLYFGSEWLVRGSSRLARRMGISALVVGLTVVSFGTSAPELVVSLVAAIGDQPDVAIGNVVGSNIMNLAVILGLTAVICPIRIEIQLVRREIPFMILVTLAMVVFALDGLISRIDGALLLAGFVGYLARTLRVVEQEPPSTEKEYEVYQAGHQLAPGTESTTRNLLLVVAGTLTLVIAARLIVGAALFFGRAMGVSELVIGLTIVAVGTSLPELATSLAAALKQEADIAAGNIIGSNIFNILSILGTVGVVRPIPVSRSLLTVDAPVMVGLSIMVLPLAWWQYRLGRWEGSLLIAGYVAFAVLLFTRFPN